MAAPGLAGPASARPAHACAVRVLTSVDPVSGIPADEHGERFVTGATATAGRDGERPVRVYVPRDAAATPAERARLAVAALDRSGGLDRSVVLVAVPAGSGWVDEAAAATLEDRTRGDVASVAVQYAALPSWLAYLAGGAGAEESVRALVSAGAAGCRPVRRLVHADDPVASWSPALLVHPDRDLHGLWLPVLSFWQATADAAVARAVPAGHGHRYEGELGAAWDALLGGRCGPGAPLTG